jgi:hypothetical protein
MPARVRAEQRAAMTTFLERIIEASETEVPSEWRAAAKQLRDQE